MHTATDRKWISEAHRADSTTPRAVRRRLRYSRRYNVNAYDRGTVPVFAARRDTPYAVNARWNERTNERVNRQVSAYEVRNDERASNARCALSPLRLRSRDWKWRERAPSDFRGIHRHPYRRGGRCPCLLALSNPRAALPLPRRPHHRAQPCSSAPHLPHSGQEEDATLYAPTWLVCISAFPPLSGRDRANHGCVFPGSEMLTTLLSKYQIPNLRNCGLKLKLRKL